MKTYIPGNPNPVQRQPKVPPSASTGMILGRPAHPANGPVLFLGLAARLRREPAKYALRKQLAEHPFGTIQRRFGYDHFLLKGLAKVRTEWSLITLAYNFKRVLNLVNFEKLMAAVS